MRYFGLIAIIAITNENEWMLEIGSRITTMTSVCLQPQSKPTFDLELFEGQTRVELTHTHQPRVRRSTPVQFGPGSAQNCPTPLILFDFRQDKWANPATRFGIGSARKANPMKHRKIR
jgi:hypothetical protein